MIERIQSVLVVVSLLAVAGVVFMFARAGKGPLPFNAPSSGPPATDFAALDYRVGDEGYLLCGDGCPNAFPDGDAVFFPVSRAALRRAVAAAVDSRPDIRSVRLNLEQNQFDFAERMAGQRFPTLITLRLERVSETASRMIIYSSQPVGEIGIENHPQKVARWVRMIGDAAKNGRR